MHGTPLNQRAPEELTPLITNLIVTPVMLMLNDGLSAIFSKRAQVPYLKSLFYEACDLYLNFNGNMFIVACNAFSGHSP